MRKKIYLIIVLISTSMLTAGAQDRNRGVVELVQSFLTAEDESSGQLAKKDLKTSGTDVWEVERMLRQGIRHKEAPSGWRRLDAVAIDRVSRYFLFYVPERYTPEKPAGLLLELHGGVGGLMLPSADVLQNNGDRMWRETADKYNIIVALPTGQKGAEWWTKVGTSTILEVIRRIKRRYNLDDNKIFISGFSDGGSAAIHMALHNPTPFAGFIALNGTSRAAEVSGGVYPQNLGHKRPMFIVNTTDDPIFPSDREKPIIKMFKKAGANIKFTVYPNLGHELRYFDRERPKIEKMMRKTQRRPLPDHLTWLTDNAENWGRFAWVAVEEMGGDGDVPPLLHNVKILPKLRLGVYINPNYTGTGVELAVIIQNSTAERMGLRKGDIIHWIDGKEIKELESVSRILDKKNYSDKIEVTVKRNGRMNTLDGEFPPRIKRAVFNHSGPFCRIQVDVERDTIHVNTYQIKKYRLLISQTMFPRETPIKIYTNGKLSFSGIVEPDMETLLHYAALDLDRKMIFYGSVAVRIEK